MENITDTNAPSKRTTSMEYKDIQIEYALRGLGAVQTAVVTGKASLNSLKRATELLVADPSIDASDLVDWVNQITPEPSGRGPGRGAIEPGDIRNYKVQDVKGSQFLRLPTSSLSKAMSVPVEFSADGGRLIVHLDRATLPVLSEDDTEA
jgi:hypothetical protein